MVEGVYKAPQIGDDQTLGELLEQYSSDYRRLYIEHPRVRLDGVYIAICQYMSVMPTLNVAFFVLTFKCKQTVRAE